MCSMSKKKLVRLRKNNKIKKTLERTLRNRQYKNNYKYHRRQIMKSLHNGTAVVSQLYQYRSIVDKLSSKRIIHRNTASRLKSNMHLQFNAFLKQK